MFLTTASSQPCTATLVRQSAWHVIPRRPGLSDRRTSLFSSRSISVKEISSRRTVSRPTNLPRVDGLQKYSHTALRLCRRPLLPLSWELSLTRRAFYHAASLYFVVACKGDLLSCFCPSKSQPLLSDVLFLRSSYVRRWAIAKQLKGLHELRNKSGGDDHRRRINKLNLISSYCSICI